MTTIPRDEFDELVRDAHLTDNQWKDDYSGRYMFGRTCLAVVGKPAELVRFTLAFGDLIGRDAATEILQDMRSDNFGRDTVWYWPTLCVEPVDVMFGDQDVDDDEDVTL